MTTCIRRKHRWTPENARQYTSRLGRVVYAKGAWFGLLGYKTLVLPVHERGLATWLFHVAHLGPFQRPYNAMIAVERKATNLRNQLGEQILFNELV